MSHEASEVLQPALKPSAREPLPALSEAATAWSPRLRGLDGPAATPSYGRFAGLAFGEFEAETPTTYAKYIGRVGALAVALGIGGAIATAPGVAWADESSSSSASDKSSTSTASSSASDESSTSTSSASNHRRPGLSRRLLPSTPPMMNQGDSRAHRLRHRKSLLSGGSTATSARNAATMNRA